MLLEAVIQEATREDYCSCFLIKTRLELGAERNEIDDFSSGKLGEVEALLENYLNERIEQENESATSRQLDVTYFRLRVYGYQQDSADRIREGLREGLAWLPW